MIVLVREVRSLQHPAPLKASSAGSSCKCVEENDIEHKPFGTVVPLVSGMICGQSYQDGHPPASTYSHRKAKGWLQRRLGPNPLVDPLPNMQSGAHDPVLAVP